MINDRAFKLHFAIFSIYVITLFLLFFKMVQFFIKMKDPDSNPSD